MKNSPTRVDFSMFGHKIHSCRKRQNIKKFRNYFFASKLHSKQFQRFVKKNRFGIYVIARREKETQVGRKSRKKNIRNVRREAAMGKGD